MVLQDGKVDDHSAFARKDLRESDVRRTPILYASSNPRNVGTIAANLIRISVDGESACLKVASVPVPDEDVARLHSGLLKALGDRIDEHRVRGNSLTAEPVGL